MAGLETPNSGEVTLAGRTPRPGSPLVRMMFQDARLLPWRRVLDNVALGLPKERREEAKPGRPGRGRAGGAGRRLAEHPLRRAAAAGGPGAGAGLAAQRPPARRAAGRARCADAAGDAGADRARLAGAWLHRRPGHPRRRGGGRPGGPDHRPRGRAGRARPASRSAAAARPRRAALHRDQDDDPRSRCSARDRNRPSACTRWRRRTRWMAREPAGAWRRRPARHNQTDFTSTDRERMESDDDRGNVAADDRAATTDEARCGAGIGHGAAPDAGRELAPFACRAGRRLGGSA